MRRSLIALLAVVLWLVAPVQADVSFSDGEIHNVNGPVPGSLRAYDGPGGALDPTTINFLTGAATTQMLVALGTSRVNMYDGSVGTTLRARNYGTVIMYGGTVFQNAEAWEYSSLVMYGGKLGKNLMAKDHSNVTMYDGIVGLSVYASEYGSLSVYGGSLQNIVGQHDSNINIYGGSIGSGSTESWFWDRSTINVYGIGFNYPYGPIEATVEAGVLTGTLAMGDSLNMQFKRINQGGVTINLIPVAPVPAPAAVILGMLGLGTAGWRLRRRPQ